jgi:hypothetical protein
MKRIIGDEDGTRGICINGVLLASTCLVDRLSMWLGGEAGRELWELGVFIVTCFFFHVSDYGGSNLVVMDRYM